MKKILLNCLFIIVFYSNYAQTIVNDTLNVNFLNTPMNQFIHSMEKEAHLNFIYKEEWLSEATITVNKEQASIADILDEGFQRTPFTYVFMEPNMVIILRKENFVKELPTYNFKRQKNILADNDQLKLQERYLKGRQPDEKKVIIVGKKANAQAGRKAIVTAKLIDAETQEPLIGATMFVEETKTGAASNENGELSLALQPGDYSAEFSSIGMASYKCVLTIKSDGNFVLEMLSETQSLEEVTISGQQNYKIRGNELGLDRINVKSIKELPTLMGEKDIIKIAQMLPGIVSVSEGSSGINVRGGSVDQNLFYISEVPLYNTSHLFGFFSSINSAIVKDFSIYKGHVPAMYGGRLSSIFNVETIKGSKEKFFTQGGISPISANLSLEGPLVKGKSSYVLSGRSSYSDWILQRMPQQDLKNSSAFFYDLSGAIDYEINKNNRINLFNYYSSDFFNFNKLEEYSYSNLGNGINYSHRFSKRIKSDFDLVNAKYAFESKNMNNASEAYSQNFVLAHTEAKAKVEWLVNDKHSLSIGGNAILYNLDRGEIAALGVDSKRTKNDLGQEQAIESAIYLDENFDITKKIKLYAGIRYSMFNNIGPQQVLLYDETLPPNKYSITDTLNFKKGESVSKYSDPEIRAAIDFKLTNFSSIKLSYNEMHQYLFLLSNSYSVAPTDQWKLSDYHIKPAESKQVSAGYYQNLIGLGLSVSGEVYYKMSDNVLEFKDGADFINTKEVERMTLQGKQNAYGAEFMIARDEGKLNGWLSYAYSRSFMEFDGEYDWTQINNGEIYPSNYDKPNVVNFVGNYRFNRRVIFSTNVVYSTGRPITLPQSVYYVDGMKFVNYSARNEYRIPDYFRIDVSLTLEGNLKANKRFHSYWMFNVYNLTGRNNPYSVYYVSEGNQINGYKYSVIGVPIFTVSWNFKLGNYANN